MPVAVRPVAPLGPGGPPGPGRPGGGAAAVFARALVLVPALLVLFERYNRWPLRPFVHGATAVAVLPEEEGVR